MEDNKPETSLSGRPVSETSNSAMSPLMEVMDGMKEYILWLEGHGNADYMCLYANRSFLKGLGYKIGDISGEPLSGFISTHHYRTLSALLEQLQSTTHKESSIHNPLRLSFKQNGKIEWTELACYASLCDFKNGRTVFLYCTEIDPQYRRAFRYSQLYEEALDGIFTLHKSGEIKNGNKKLEELVGSRKGRLTVDLLKKFMPKKKAEGLVKYLSHRLKGDMENYPYYINITTQDGKEKHYSVRTINNPVTESEIIVYIRDVSDVKRLENDLRESESKYRSVVEQSGNIIFLAKPDKLILANRINRIAYQRVGDLLQNPNLHWKEYTKNILAPDRERIIDILTQGFKSLEEGSDISNRATEFRLKFRNDEIFHMAMTISSISYRGEKALLGTMRDITESKILEAKTTESVKLGTLAQFAASVAHEIRNPLEALTSAGLLLSRSLILEGDDKLLLDAINNATADINTVVKQFVSMTTVPEYHFTEANIKALFNSVIKTVKGLQSYNPGVSITVSHQRGLPDIQCDTMQLHTTLINIINNACNAIPGKGTIKIRVEKTELTSREAVKIAIKDNGEGIAPDVLSQIWKPFFTSKKKGMGLGLFIAKHCIETHGGHIGIPYSDKRGTMVQIVLPILQKAR
jgi:PAS domain S-box-containing protein